ncbi:MAG: transglycosylase domain-containing protein [bacterium]|nr:transglycosylase domain-containing protein [bacterium]
MKLWRWLKKRTRFQKFLLFLGVLLVAFGGFIYFYVFAGLPSIYDIEKGYQLPATRIYDRNGLLLYEIRPPGEYGGLNSTIALADIPTHCQNAVIATEDANYYYHPGVDVIGLARAFVINLQGGEVLAGGSTITQQTARLLLLDPANRLERTLQRKLKEMALALQLQTAYSKDQILELYLNQNYFGNLAYGIEGAARTYFAKSADSLSLAECALLAGLMQNPTYYDPFTNLENAKERQQIVLGLMVQNNYITQTDADSAFGDELQFAATRFPIEAPHAVMAVWEILEREYPEVLYTRGLDVITTIDLNWQNSAQDIMQRQLDALNHPVSINKQPVNANNGALVAIDPYTGQIRVLLGSPNYFDESIDGALNAAYAYRQPGSALKPFTYAAAMNPNLPVPLTAATMMLDVKTPFVTRKLESYVPANYGLVEHGPVSLRESLASSYNIPAVEALEYVGLEAMITLSANAGMDNLINNTTVDLSITLGGGEVRLIDMVQAYSIFPNGGYHVEPSIITTITTADGETLYQWQAPPLDEQVLDERVAFIITDILSDNYARMGGFGLNSALNIGRPAAAKTGTTTDHRDNWVVGYTPNLVVGVWVGNADNSAMVESTGVTGAAPIWNQFMRSVLLGQPELEFDRPEGLVRAEVCHISGLLPTDACPQTRMEWFIEGTVPTQYDNMYQTFILDTRTGALADENTPIENRVERVFLILPQQAQAWGERNGVRQVPVGAVYALPDAEEGTRLLQPDPYSIFQIAPNIPIETQRIKFRAATSGEAQSVVFILNDEEIATDTSAPYEHWWQLAVGDYRLRIVATLTDGTQETSDEITYRVNEYEAPSSYTVETP